MSERSNFPVRLTRHQFGFERLPDGYDLYKTDPAAFRKDLVDHIEEFANLYPEAFSEWDVMNEPYTEYDFMDLLGRDVVVEWFETARNANPGYPRVHHRAVVGRKAGTATAVNDRQGKRPGKLVVKRFGASRADAGARIVDKPSNGNLL